SRSADTVPAAPRGEDPRHARVPRGSLEHAEAPQAPRRNTSLPADRPSARPLDFPRATYMPPPYPRPCLPGNEYPKPSSEALGWSRTAFPVRRRLGGATAGAVVEGVGRRRPRGLSGG